MSGGLNIGGRDVETLTGFASNYRTPEGEHAPIKVATLNSWVEKARKAEELKPAVCIGGSFMYFVDDLEKLPLKYGRKAAAARIHPEQHETVVKDNVRLAAENAQLSDAVDYLNEMIEQLRHKIGRANDYIARIESPSEPVSV